MTGELPLAPPVSVTTSADHAPRVCAAETGTSESGEIWIITSPAIAHSCFFLSYSITHISALHIHPAEMASRTATRALRSSLRQAAKAPAVQQRTFVSAVNAASRPALAQAPKAAQQFVQQRGVKTIDFAGHKEDVYGMHDLRFSRR